MSTITLNDSTNIGVTFNKAVNNKIIGAKVTVTGTPIYNGKTLAPGEFDVTSTDGTSWTSSEAENDTYKSFITGPVTEDAAVVTSTDAAVVTSTDAAVVTSSGGSRKSNRRTKNRNSKRRRSGRSKRRYVNH